MIQKDHELPVTRGRNSPFLDVLARSRAGGSLEELALVSGGWRAERARMRRTNAWCGCAVLRAIDHKRQ